MDMSDMGSARVFVGLKPPQTVSQLIVRYQKELQEAIAERGPGIYLPQGSRSSFVRWTAEDSLHLTLHFIGAVSRQLLDSFQSRFRAKVSELKPFKVSLGLPGFLPNIRRNMRVVYLSVLDSQGNLDYLASLIRSCVSEQLGIDSKSICTYSGSSASSDSELKESRVFPRDFDQSAASKAKEKLVDAFSENPRGKRDSKNLSKRKNDPFLPHITLGRLERSAKREDRDHLASLISKASMLNVSSLYHSDIVEWEVNSFIFYESVQENGRSRYEVLEEFHF